MRYLCVRALIAIFSLAKIALISGFWQSWPNLVQTRQVYVGNTRAPARPPQTRASPASPGAVPGCPPPLSSRRRAAGGGGEPDPARRPSRGEAHLSLSSGPRTRAAPRVSCPAPPRSCVVSDICVM